jgi:hypothetical protein
MSADGFTSLMLSGFQATPLLKGDTLELSLRGNADMTVSSVLKTFLRALDTHAKIRGVRSVHVQLEELYFMNSSCLQAIAAWLVFIASRETEAQYQVTFVTHSAHDWQRRSLEAIRRVAPKIVAVI